MNEDRILIVTTDGYWARPMRQLLSRAMPDYRVSSMEYRGTISKILNIMPKLIIFSCLEIDDTVLEFVQKIDELTSPIPILILGNTRPKIQKEQMRLAFLSGAFDVTERPTNNDDIVELVNETLALIEKQTDTQLF